MESKKLNSEASKPANTSQLFWIVIAGILLYVVLDVIAQLLPPHYSPISQAESDLAVGMYGYIMTINFVNRGIFSLVFIYALVRTVHLSGASSGQYRTGTLLLGVWGVGALLLAAFPTDVPATPVSWHGAIHLLVAVLAFLGGAFGELSLSLRFGPNNKEHALKRYALLISVLALIFCLIDLGLPFVAPHLATSVGGLVERIFLGFMLLWMAVVSFYLIRKGSLSDKPT
jgi:hypothetical membrane protein